jgi:hypothetical protein
MKIILSSISLFFLLSSQIFSMYCPYCGTKNEDSYSFCYSCGNQLPKASVTPVSKPSRAFIESPARKSTSNIPTHGRPAPKGIFSAPSSGPNAVSTAHFMQGLRQMMGSDSVGTLLNLQGQNIDSSQLMELNQNPQVQQLMQQMKSTDFQQQLLEGLRMLAPSSNNSSGMESQIKQMEGLFQMLNSAGSQNLFQP